MLRPLCVRMLFRSLLALCCVSAAMAEEPLPEQPTPFSVWLDFSVLSRPGAADPALPIWFESLQTLRTPAVGEEPPKTIYRLRLRRLPSLQKELLVRVFFDDLPDMQPTVSAWTETGTERFRSKPLGTGLALPTSESLIVPLDGADYLDVEVPGNGSNVRGTLATSLKDITVRQAIDFASPTVVLDPFGNVTEPWLSLDDSKLYGRVQAALDGESIRLTIEDQPDVVYEFALSAQPLAALLTFEVLNADLTAPPAVIVNGESAVFANVHWPDLADPGYRGEARGTEAVMRFQYTGWLGAQVPIPANAVRPGLNKVTISLSQDSGPVAIRNVQLQLKQNWKHFDYILTPATR